MRIEQTIIPRQATCLFTDEPDRVHRDLEAWVETADGLRLVSVERDRIQTVRGMTDALLSELAEALLLLWPDWYHGTYPLDRRAEFPVMADRIVRDQPLVNPQWLAAAATLSDENRPPRTKQFSATVQARQLRLALSDGPLIVAVFVTERDPSSARLLGLARALEWLAREADATVAAVLPLELAGCRELDAINSGAQIWPPERANRATSQAVPVREESTPASAEERKHRVCPIIGRPHPASPGEQLIARQLQGDDELRELFEFNQRVRSVFENRFIVDLLWQAGRIVVEIDGYGWHTSRAAFHADRERDYELTLSGYLVLRLPHEFVVQDPALACERIREFVRFRQQHPLQREMTA
jgi:very-short-patch-repair endonuclease